MKTSMEYAWSRPNPAGSAWDESVAAADQTKGADAGDVHWIGLFFQQAPESG